MYLATPAGSPEIGWGQASLEQEGNIAESETALRRAVALAPAYSFPHWYLGNLLLRNNRFDEAFPELRTATEADNELRPQLFNFV